MSDPARATLRVPCVLMRGGTSRGLVFRREDLPRDRALWDPLFLAAIGSPDPRQLDGVGAGDSHTSKVAVVSAAEAPGADVDYLFGEVAILEPRVDYAANSGNIIAALGLYAVEEGLVEPRAPETLVRVRNVNTDKIIEVTVPCTGAGPVEDGEFTIDGVPGPGPRIDLRFPRPEGAVTGRLLPAGEARTSLDVSGLGTMATSLVDAANPVVLARGEDLDVDPGRGPAELNADEALMERIQALRGAASVRMGLVPRAEDAWGYSPMIPFPVLLFPACTYPRLGGGEPVAAPEMDLCIRVVSLGLVHKSINVTVSVAVSAAAMTPGTLAHELAGARGREGVRIGHPSGVVRTRGSARRGAGGETVIDWIGVGRTARRIMQGEVVVPAGKLRWLRELMGTT